MNGNFYKKCEVGSDVIDYNILLQTRIMPTSQVGHAWNVPHGTILGPSEQSDFTQPFGQVIRPNSISPHFALDDSPLCVHRNKMQVRMHY